MANADPLICRFLSQPLLLPRNASNWRINDGGKRETDTLFGPIRCPLEVLLLFDPTDADFDDGRHDVPRYCSRCHSETIALNGLCPACGDRTEPQGYCAVCETYWSLPVGSDCPKHDIPLTPPPEIPAVFRAGEPTPDWVTIAHFPDGLAASVPRIRLEGEGIPTYVSGERMGGRSMYQMAVGGVSLQVPRPLIAEARVLLDQSWELPEDPEDLDDAWDELAPDPGSFRRSVMKGAIVVVLIGPGIITLLSILARL